MMRSGRTQWVQITVLLVAGVLFAVPILSSAAFGFSLPDEGFTLTPFLQVFDDARFLPQLLNSLQLMVLTVIAAYALIVPTLIWLHLKAPQLLGIAEALSIFPYVVPAVAIVSGANLTFRTLAPGFLTSLYSLVPFYVILVLPFVYRAVDTGIRAINLPTLTAASESLGAGWIRTIFTVIVPNLKPALLTGALLSAAIVLGEFVVANLLLHSTFPTFMTQIGADKPRAAAALAFLTILGTWLLLALMARAAAGSTRSTSSSRSSVQAVAPVI